MAVVPRGGGAGRGSRIATLPHPARPRLSRRSAASLRPALLGDAGTRAPVQRWRSARRRPWRPLAGALRWSCGGRRVVGWLSHRRVSRRRRRGPRRARRRLEPGPVRALGRGPRLSSTTRRRSPSAGCCRPARWSRASWPTASRSKTASGPIFIGHGFGNYDDRLQRDDVRYILTYDLPTRRLREPAIGTDSGNPRSLSQPPTRSRRSTSTRRRAPIARCSSTSTPVPRRADQDRIVREISEDLIKAHADRRFRSEYDYALFEYYRSAKVIAFLERAGVDDRAAACSTPAAAAAACRCRSPSTRAKSSASIRSTASATPASGWRASAASRNLHFARADGMALPFAAGAFDLVLSHAVIEHVADAPLYLRECRARAGAGRPRLPVDGAVPLVRRRAPAAAARAGAAAPDRRPRASRSRRSACWRGTRRGRCKEPAHENSFIRDARNGIVKHDDLLEKVTRAPAARPDRRRRACASSARNCT